MAGESAAVAAQRAATARPGGMAGGMPMGGHGAHGGEDDEHKSPDYLVTEDNGNAIIGDLPPTAPPVIG
jgi:hypothetical protein